MHNAIEVIRDGQTILAYIIRVRGRPTHTTFYTDDDASMQVGHIVYAAGQEIQRHLHLPIERHLRGTGEVLIVQHGRCEVDVYADDRRLIRTCPLEQGDVVISLAGGHGFRLLEDTVLLEVKQGPYPGVEAVKTRF